MALPAATGSRSPCASKSCASSTASPTASRVIPVRLNSKVALRLKPVAPLNGLETNIATRIGEIEVPPGTPVLALTRHCALQDQYFSNAKQFNPHRWLSNDTHLNHETSAFLPFGTGPRFCPGRNLALAEIKMCLAMLVKYFDFKRDADRKPVRESLAFTMYPANLHVEFALR